jgi:hypothetical protein
MSIETAKESNSDDRDLTQDKHSQMLSNYGPCSLCVCPGYQGSGYECTRGGCGHHYDSHG